MVRARTSCGRQHGGVLLAAAGILVLLALISFALFAQRQAARRLDRGAGEQLRLVRIDDALARFVAQHRRLPCPASGALASGTVGAGVERINLVSGQCVPASQADGVVPWITLGLAEEEAADAWAGRITYRVQPSLASNLLSLMNMRWCDPAGATGGAVGPANACTPAPCVAAACMHPNNFLYAKGLQVQDGALGWLNRPAPPWAGAPAPPPPSSGAAYVLIAHGANGAGAYNANGILQAGQPGPGSDEMANRNGIALSASSMFIDKAAVLVPGPGYFDDSLSHPTVSAVLDKAALGPRAH